MTNTQKQCLLTFLGYDTGGIGNGWGEKSRQAVECAQEDLGIEPDGVWGPQTETAVLQAVYTYDDNAPEDETDITGSPDLDAQLADRFKGIRYWSPEEFRCQCGGRFCNGFPALPDRTLLELADDLRYQAGGPGHRSSGLRCPQHNANEGGVDNSKHKYGKALDFKIEGMTGQQLCNLAKADLRTSYTYVIGNGPYVHVDVK